MILSTFLKNNIVNCVLRSNRKVAPYFCAQKSEKFNFGYIPVRKVNNFFGQTADFSLLGSRKGKVYKSFKISGKTTYQLSFRNWKRSEIKNFVKNRKNVLFGYIADRKKKKTFMKKGKNTSFGYIGIRRKSF